MTKTVRGTIHGKTIELTQDLGLTDGDQVEVTVRLARHHTSEAWGEGLRRCAGALADSWTDKDDRILEQIYQERKTDTRRELGD